MINGIGVFPCIRQPSTIRIIVCVGNCAFAGKCSIGVVVGEVIPIDIIGNSNQVIGIIGIVIALQDHTL